MGIGEAYEFEKTGRIEPEPKTVILTKEDFESLCGCGKKVQYMVTTSEITLMACNKYGRCMSYDELTELLGEVRLENAQLRAQAESVVKVLAEVSMSAASAAVSIKKLLENIAPENATDGA